MRQERTVQASLFDLFAEHEIGRELRAMSLVAGRASRSHRASGGGSAPAWRYGDRATGSAGRVGLALRASQAASPAEL